MIIELVAFSIFIVLFSILVFYSYMLKRKREKLLSIIVQLEMDKRILSQRLAEALLQLLPQAKAERAEGFLRFLSESRDWAFKYIEDVQLAIGQFSSRINPELDYLKTQEFLVGPSHASSFNKISEAYAELLKVMPTDSDKKNQSGD